MGADTAVGATVGVDAVGLDTVGIDAMEVVAIGCVAVSTIGCVAVGTIAMGVMTMGSVASGGVVVLLIFLVCATGLSDVSFVADDFLLWSTLWPFWVASIACHTWWRVNMSSNREPTGNKIK